MKAPTGLMCPVHESPLPSATDGSEINEDSSDLACPEGDSYPVIGGIPRFVSPDNYAAAFGEQWKSFRRTQLDSYTGTTISEDRLRRCLGSFDAIDGKLMLEAGCGAGRFTELLLKHGAHLFACDLSVAVEANRENCGQADNYFVCQADIMKLPVAPASFDVAMCLGVIQHTPDPEATIERLCSYVAPGGLLVIDHYRYDHRDMTMSRQKIRNLLIRTSPRTSLAVIRTIVALLWPIHRLVWHGRRLPFGARARQLWLNLSPVLDYHDDYLELGPKLLYAWAALDTHDALTDRYKHKRTVEEITAALERCGMEQIEAWYGGNGVEARARKPA